MQPHFKFARQRAQLGAACAPWQRLFERAAHQTRRVRGLGASGHETSQNETHRSGWHEFESVNAKDFTELLGELISLARREAQQAVGRKMHRAQACQQMQRRRDPGFIRRCCSDFRGRSARHSSQCCVNDTCLIDEHKVLATYASRQHAAPSAAHHSRRSEAQRRQGRLCLSSCGLGMQKKIREDEHELAHIAYVIGA